jgi:uncharacterized protein with HEPN domain
MPSREWPLRVQDILESITEIEESVRGITFEDFAKNPMLVKAVLYDLIIIGEASSHIPNEIQSRYPLVPWRLMKGMRNVATHEYFQYIFKTSLGNHSRGFTVINTAVTKYFRG